MSLVTEQLTQMVDMLPESEQNLALEVIKRLVLAWDPDYTKVTKAEAEAHAAALDEYAKGDYV